MTSSEIRKTFIDFFTKNQHQHVKSSSLIPHDDPTLLFNNAGMNQFKNLFLGLESKDYKRAVSSQKCVRAGGKHNDLENVGFTARHHTFFEMLGNFSFGDYFKEEAISFAWQFLTQELGLPKDKLYVTVFETDDEAFNIWHNQEGVPKDRIYRFGEKDNFWRMGKVGPCGPCSEIFYDFGPEIGGDPKDNVMGGEGDRYMEIWNLVFMQFHEDEKGNQNPLPKPSIDTGGGLERFATVLQNKLNNYDTDAFTPIIDRAAQLSKQTYLTGSTDSQQNKLNVAFRVLADHSRSIAFLISDGVTPSNEGRGYVLRRIMRRAIRYGHQLNENESLLPKTVEVVIGQMGDVYPELVKNKSLILQNCIDEEIRFKRTINQGTDILMSALEKIKSHQQTTLPGEVTFKLYDTYGFPLDLTQVIAKENGFQVDENDFNKHMKAAQDKAKGSWKGQNRDALKEHLNELSKNINDQQGVTEFTGYNQQTTETDKAIKISNGEKEVSQLKEGETGYIAFAKTCFYAESGGQCSDTGTISADSVKANVSDCQKVLDIHWLTVEVTDGVLSTKTNCLQTVNANKRQAITSNHSATHLLHAALRQTLGDHIRQAGSLVDPEKLRFDFTHNKPVSQAEIHKIETLVNNEISKAILTEKKSMTYDQAIDFGALALFGEKYGDEVRVLKFGEFSTELCGGTHVENTSLIRLFKIVAETGVSSGVRRIEAITNQTAFEYLNKNTQENLKVKSLMGVSENWTQVLASDVKELKSTDWIEKKLGEIKDLQKKLRNTQSQKIDLDELIQAATPLEGNNSGQLVWAHLEEEDRQILSQINDKLKDKIKTGIVIILGKGAGKHPLIVGVTKDLSKSIKAGDVLKTLSKDLGGKGGGRPDFAQGAYENVDKLDLAKSNILNYIKEL